MNFSSELDKKNDSVTFSMTTMNQNLPENSILKFIDKHKSQKFLDTSLKINQLNDAGFKKVFFVKYFSIYKKFNLQN